MKQKENMKILLRGMKLSGGAPRSVYEYMKTLQKDGHRIKIIMQEKEPGLKLMYTQAFENVEFADCVTTLWENRRLVSMYRQLTREYRALKKEKPDVVFCLGYFGAMFYGRFCNLLNIPSIMIIPGGDFTDGGYLMKGNKCDHVICFSYENRNVLLNYFDDKRITVISNRIEVKQTFDDLHKHYRLSAGEPIRILVTSRIHPDKYDSIVKFIERLNREANKAMKIELAVAGDGVSFDKLREYVACIDNPYLKIELKGHLDNLIPEFKKAHIVVGRGRSVLEPVILNRLGCVISDDGKVEVCTTESFDRLYRYNFSGRNPEQHDSQKELKELLNALSSNSYDYEKIEKASALIREYYSAEFLGEKLYKVLETVQPSPQKVKSPGVLLMVATLFFRKLKRRICTTVFKKP